MCVDRLCGPESVVGAREEWGQSRKRVEYPDCLAEKLSLTLLFLAQRLCSLLLDGCRLRRLMVISQYYLD